ncbi:MAG TPA: hypothetical protein VMH78_07540 [Thermoplasmata archaeon]|nr:hypothetical protein [Thermoplasmata archaeon]
MVAATSPVARRREGPLEPVPVPPEIALVGPNSIAGLRRVMGATWPMIDALGEFMTSVGRLEMDVKMTMPELFQRTLSKDAVEAFVSKAPPDLVGQFFKVTLGFASMGKLDLNALSAEEKMQRGDRLKEMALEVKTLIAKLDELTKEVGK